jgi:hypothetical protein
MPILAAKTQKRLRAWAKLSAPKNNRKNLHQIWRMSYTHFATIKLEIKTKGCLWRKLRQPFELNLSTTDHKRTTKGPQATMPMQTTSYHR